MSYQSSLLLNMTKKIAIIGLYVLTSKSIPLHVDNAADQSFLMLGYEPSEIESELHIADYYKYANESTATKDYLKSSPNI
jgi:predicted nucleotide-binding protein (sugar kinase/HSP70/actin superfamily)